MNPAGLPVGGSAFDISDAILYHSGKSPWQLFAAVLYSQRKQADKAVRRKEGIPMMQRQFVCVKCGCTHYESDQFQATGGNFAKIFDIQNKKLITVSCTQCGYTELYKAQGKDGSDILDFLFGR